MRLTWLADVLRDAGLTVIEDHGWQQRGKDLGAVDGIVWHHTATKASTSDSAVTRLLRVGRRDLVGPLAQLGLDRQGRFHVVAAGRANHNGYGTWGNSSIGIEAYNDGIGEPWPDAQVDAYVRGTRALLDRLGLPVNRVKGHKETDPRRKIDPAGLDMDEMRRRVATGGDDEMTPEQEARVGRWLQEQRAITDAKIDVLQRQLDAQTDQIDRGIVWFMRQQDVPDAKISEILGKKNLPPKV